MTLVSCIPCDLLVICTDAFVIEKKCSFYAFYFTSEIVATDP